MKQTPQYKITERVLATPQEAREDAIKSAGDIYQREYLQRREPGHDPTYHHSKTEFYVNLEWVFDFGFIDDKPHLSAQEKMDEIERLVREFYRLNIHFMDTFAMFRDDRLDSKDNIDYAATGRKVINGAKKGGQATRIQHETERKRKKCYELYDGKMTSEHALKNEAKIKKEIAEILHCSVKTITRYLQDRDKEDK